MKTRCNSCNAELANHRQDDHLCVQSCPRCLMEARRAGIEAAAKIANEFAGRMAVSYHQRGRENKPNGVAGCKADAGVSIAALIRIAAKETP